jgi:hypothetical protein
MNDIDDARDEFAFVQLDRARYLSMPCSWSRPCAQFERSYKINTYFDALVHCSECQASRAMGASSR